MIKLLNDSDDDDNYLTENFFDSNFVFQFLLNKCRTIIANFKIVL